MSPNLTRSNNTQYTCLEVQYDQIQGVLLHGRYRNNHKTDNEAYPPDLNTRIDAKYWSDLVDPAYLKHSENW
jgi:hypothetical protein